MTLECIELNWLYQHTKKVRSSQTSISIDSCTELSKTRFCPMIIVQKRFLSISYFCRIPLRGCSYFLCSVWIRNWKCSSFSQRLHLYTSFRKKVVISWRKKPMRRITLQCTGMITVSSFLSIFTPYMNKYYQNAVTLVSRDKLQTLSSYFECHLANHGWYFLKILEEPTKY